MSEPSDPSPRNHTDAVRDIARDLADVASQIGTFKGEANAYLGDPTYNALPASRNSHQPGRRILRLGAPAPRTKEEKWRAPSTSSPPSS